MDFLRGLCIIDETLYTSCGHVITKLNHRGDCHQNNLNPFGEGFRLTSVCVLYYFLEATIKATPCSSCAGSDQTSMNEWRSDDPDALPPAEISKRVEYWTKYIEKQKELSLRQSCLEGLANAAGHVLEQIRREHPERIDSPDQEFRKLELKFAELDNRRNWFLAQQSIHCKQIRQFMPEENRIYLLHDPLDQARVNPDLLTPVRPSDVSEDDECGICRLSMTDVDACGVNGIRRTFCGHFFHHDCIINWFDFDQRTVITCPTCRAARNLMIPPTIT